MAKVNTASVREEIAHVEGELERLSAAGKVSDESRVLFNTLLMIVNLLVSVFLENTTRKTSRNSSKQPSQTKEDTTAPNARAQGQGPGEHAWEKGTLPFIIVIVGAVAKHLGVAPETIWTLKCGRQEANPARAMAMYLC